MNRAIGLAGVSLGLMSAVIGATTLAVGLLRQRPVLVRQARIYGVFTFVAALLCVVAMERALIQRDFTILYVAEHGSSRTPPLFNVATLWAALEGSIILWVLVLTGYVVAVLRKFRHRFHDPLVGWALLTMLVVCAFFFALMAGPANPFQRFDPPPGFDGPGPNPLLQNHLLMAFHPPALYLGYVGFTVPFAFAIAALVTGRLGEGWLVETRRWTLIAWGFLTAGIVLGAWWSYEVLGWGGYWAWDPVENASFLPWLTGTAYLHSVMVQERRGMLRVWNLSLLCATFSLTILGTFLTRSGVIDSVHAFTEGHIGPWLLSFFGLVVLVSIGLIGWRGDRLRSPGSIDSPVSREGAFLANNVLFSAFAFVVLLGTVFPLIAETFRGTQLSVGRPFFDRMSVPLGVALLTLMAIAPVLPWRKASGELLRERLFWPAWCGIGALVLALVLGARGLWAMLAFGLGGFAGGAAMRQVVLATRRQGWRGLVGRANGGMVVHLGVVLIAVALAASGSYSTTSELTLLPGQSREVAGHTFTYLSTEHIPQCDPSVPNQGRCHQQKATRRALVQIDGGDVYAPGLQVFPAFGQPVPVPSVRTGLVRDIYLTAADLPGRDEPDGPATIRVMVMPLALWLWVGGGVMALGTLLAVFPGRRRRGTDPVSAPAALERRPSRRELVTSP